MIVVKARLPKRSSQLAKAFGAAELCPDYHANYYAAFVIGPDGHNIEVVCHEPEA